MTSKRLPDDSTTPTALFLEGAKRCLPVIVAASPFGVLFGALAVDSGMTIAEAVIMSATIFAGASQMVGVGLFGHTIPAWVVVLSIFAVNFRHILYSASLGRRIGHWSVLRQAIAFFFLIDPVYAEAERRLEKGVDVQFAWYLGLVLPIYVGWIGLTWLGSLLGNFLNDAQKWGADFILPIYFMGLVLGFRGRSFWLPVVGVSAAASILASKTVGSPWHVSIGAVAGVLFAAFFSPSLKTKPDEEVGPAPDAIDPPAVAPNEGAS